MHTYLVIIFILTIFVNKSSQTQYGENANSCVDSCDRNFFKSMFKIDLHEENNYKLKDNQIIEILEENVDSKSNSNFDCSKNVLLRIPFIKLFGGVIVKIELEYGDTSRGTSFHIGNSPTNDLFGGDRNSTMYNAEIYANDTSISYYMSSVNLCDQEYVHDPSIDVSRLLFLNESTNFINPKSKIIIYVSEKWFRVDNLERGTSFYYNNDYLFTFDDSAALSEKCQKSSMNAHPWKRTSPFLYIGLNRMIADATVAPGAGLCNANIAFLNCHINETPDMDINVRESKFSVGEAENGISWLSELSYLEPNMDHSACSAQGVIKVKFDKANQNKILRFDLELGEVISGFTFNIGDSPTNNAYGGDSGSTSNSAEIHSNDNRFYIWLNTKYCGDTLLYKIEYNLFQSYDKVTIFVSDQRMEISNNRGYHEIFQSPYLYNLNGQNVTCNCFDTRCYPGVSSDDDVYFSINRVVGGTYRPGIGLCNAKLSWLQCRSDILNNHATLASTNYVDWHNRSSRVLSAGVFNQIDDRVRLSSIENVHMDKKQSIAEAYEQLASKTPQEVKVRVYDKGAPLIISKNATILNDTYGDAIIGIPIVKKNF